MSPFAWGILAHLVIGLAIIGSATALQWTGQLNGEILGLYGTVIGLVGGSAIQTATAASSNKSTDLSTSDGTEGG